MKKISPPGGQVVIDATDQVLGRLAVRIANTLRGKNKPTFLPNRISGERVLITNAAKIRVTGRKREQKRYFWHTGHPGGLRSKALGERLKVEPEAVIIDAVRGMLPRNRLRDEWMKRLTVVKGNPSQSTVDSPPPAAEQKSGGSQ
jgi:large subunit ribosomal protein L13